MSSDDHGGRSGSQIDLAIERALESARVQAGDAATISTTLVEQGELSAVEADGGAVDGD